MSALHKFHANATENIAACARQTSAEGLFGAWSGASIQRLLGLTLLALQLAGLSGCARSIPAGYQERKLYPEEITAEDRAQFIEALDRYPRKELPRVKWSQTVYAWLDNTHVALSVRETPDGWKAKDGELARIIIIDTDTNSITDSPYRGELMCFSYPLNKVLIRQPRDGQSMLNHRYDDLFLAGQWGGPLKPVEWTFKGTPVYFAQWSCEQQFYVKSETRNAEVKELKLLPGHGTLHYPFGRALMTANRPVTEWLDEAGKVLGQWPYREAEFPIWFDYLPWENAYWDATAGDSRLYRTKGEIEVIPRPELLSRWIRRNVGTASGWRVRSGNVWEFIGLSGYWRRQGLYLQADKALIRVDDGEWSINKTLSVSPNGCRIAASRIARDPTRTAKPGPLTMMNFCPDSTK